MLELIHIQKVTFDPRNLRAILSFAQNGPVMTNANPQATERVKWLVPEIMRHACTGDKGKTFGTAVGRTEIAHLVEHVALELMALTNLSTPITSGRTRRIADHLYEVQIAAPDDVLATSALASAVFIVNWAFQARDSKNAPNIDAIVSGIRNVMRTTEDLDKEIQAEKEAAEEAKRLADEKAAEEQAAAGAAGAAGAGAAAAEEQEASQGAEKTAEQGTGTDTSGQAASEQLSAPNTVPEQPSAVKIVGERKGAASETVHTEFEAAASFDTVPSVKPAVTGNIPVRKMTEHKSFSEDRPAEKPEDRPAERSKEKPKEKSAEKKEIHLGTTVGFMSPTSPQNDEEYQA